MPFLSCDLLLCVGDGGGGGGWFALQPDREPFQNPDGLRPWCVCACWSGYDASKATGPDDIPAAVLKECCTELSSPLAKVFTMCFRAGVQPSFWKLAHVVPIHKKSPKTNPAHYRPVSLLSIISKVLEKIINQPIVNHLERRHLLPDSQFGFRRGRRTAHILAALKYEWVHALGHGGCAQVLAMDIAGDFDLVSHIGLLHKAQTAGINGSLHRRRHRLPHCSTNLRCPRWVLV